MMLPVVAPCAVRVERPCPCPEGGPCVPGCELCGVDAEISRLHRRYSEAPSGRLVEQLERLKARREHLRKEN